ncbi:MAG: PQQ-binding-like beta-propeller repeat protein [Candidatus Bathyarchaeia archaeon]
MRRRSTAFLSILLTYTVMTAQIAASGLDTSWSSPRHDNRNTGFSLSRVSLTNQTAWISRGVATLTPIVSDGKVYCAGGKGAGLTALDLYDGSMLWTNMLGSFSTPTFTAGVIYVGTLGGEIWALDSNTGDIVWKYSIYGYGQPLNTPQVMDGRVFFNNRDGWLFCINATNADFLWKYETRLAEVSGLAVADGRVFTIYSALNATDGTSLWEIWESGDKPAWIHYAYHTPTVVDGKVFLSIGPSIRVIDEFNGSLIWRFDTVQDPSDVAVAYGNVFVTADNSLYCLDEEDGREVWRCGAEFGWLSGIPSVADGKVLVPAYDKLICVNADNGTFLWSFSTIRSRALPAVAGDMVLFSAPEGIVAIGEPVAVSTDNSGLIVVSVSLIVAGAAILVLILKRKRKRI